MGYTVIVLKNFKDGNRYRLKGEELNVTPWKRDELIKKKIVKLK